MNNVLVRITVPIVLAAGIIAPPAARAANAETNLVPAGAPEAQTSPANLVNVDGTLNLDGGYSGALDLSGWNVQMDPERGPVFSLPGTESPAPLSTASLGHWADLGGGNGALSNEVHAIAVMGSDVFVGGHFTNVDNNAAADYIARWDGASWHNVGTGFAGEGSLTSSVSALAVDGTDLYAGGWFCGVYNGATYVSDACKIAMWDGSNWSNIGTGGGGQGAISGPVYALALDGIGNLYAGGSFVNVKNAAGTPMPAADYLVKWDGSAWSALGSGAGGEGSIDSEVHDLAIIGTDVYAGGWFTNVNNGGSAVTAADYVAKWNGSTWSALGNDGGGTPNGSLSSVVFSIAVDGTDVYVGGGFFNVKNGLTTLDAADYIAKWNGSAWSALGSGSGGNGALNATVYEIAVSGTNVYVGGSFMDANNGGTAVTEADSIAVFSNVAGGWSALGDDGAGNGSVPCCVTGLAVSGSNVYVGGSFTQVRVPGDVLDEADHLARWDGSDWSAMGAVQGALNDYVHAVAVSGTDVYVGGNFRNLSNHGTPLPAADYIARWDGSNWHALGSGFGVDGAITSTVSSIAVSGTNVYAGGYFGWIYNADAYLPEARAIAKWDGSNWSALGSDGAGGGSITSAVLAVAVSGSDVYVGGYFQDVIDVDTTILSAADYIAKWDGSNWSALGSGSGGNGSLNGEVRALALSGSDVYAGGSFYDVNNGGSPVEEADYIAKWNGSSWSALGSDGVGGGALNNAVSALALSGSNLYAGGDFTDVYNAGSPVLEADYIAKWDGGNWSGLGDNGSGGGALNAAVTSIALRGSSVYAGGSFTDVDNGGGALTAADYVALWTGTSWSALGSNGLTDGSVGAPIRALGLTSTELYAGGYFVNVNDNGTVLPYGDYIAAYGIEPPPAPADFDGDHTSDIVVYRAGAWNFYDFTSGLYLPGSSKWTGYPGGACIAAPMDYDGDGTKDFTQLCSGAWNFYNDAGAFVKGIWVGNIAGLKPVPADYDGDNIDDVVVFNAGAWNKYDYTSGAYVSGVWTGNPGGNGIPSPMDYDGNGTADPTILSGGAWHFYNDNGSYNKGIWVGNIAGQLPVPGDYYGDGIDDVMVYRAGAWLPYNFTTGAYLGANSVWTGNPAPPVGGGATKPAPLDYDGDGTLDFTVFAGGPWHFYNDNGSYSKGIWVGKNVADVPISRRPLP